MSESAVPDGRSARIVRLSAQPVALEPHLEISMRRWPLREIHNIAQAQVATERQARSRRRNCQVESCATEYRRPGLLEYRRPLHCSAATADVNVVLREKNAPVCRDW